MQNRIDVLDHGFVELVDHMGDDRRIEQAARVSYVGHNDDERPPEKTRALLRFMMKSGHSSPFEHVSFTFAVKVPMFVWRQWIRHRTAKVNELSGRYAQVPSETYVPALERMQVQSSKNHQGSGDELVEGASTKREIMHLEGRRAFDEYQLYLDAGLAKELARINLPLSTYTAAYWTIDLHNLFHFLELRLDPHSQYEIRVYAEAIAELIKPIVPLAWEAFDDYVLGSTSFSRKEMQMLRGALRDFAGEVEYGIVGMSKREHAEFMAKLEVD